MKKLTLLLLLAALAVAGWSGWQIRQAPGGFSSFPWENEVPLDNLSKAADSPDGSVAVILSSKQQIGSISPDGKLGVLFTREGAKDGMRRDFTEIAVDGQGNYIVLDTVLDAYGLYVTDEQIVRYDKNGRQDAVLYEHKGNGQSKRIGQLKGLQVSGDSLYFFETGSDKVTLNRLPLSGGKAAAAFEFELPDNRYLSEIVGTAPGEIFYSTKRGSIFKVEADGTSTSIYPLANMDRTRKNFPEGLAMGAAGNLMFVDRLLNSVTVMNPEKPDGLKVRIKTKELEEAAPDAESYEITNAHPLPDGGTVLLLNDRLLRYDGSGRLTGGLAHAYRTHGEISAAWLRWSGLAAGLLLLAASLRMFYVHLMQRRFSLFLKMVLITVPLIVISMILLSNFIYDSFSSRMESEMQRELALLARNGKNLIDGDKLQNLHSPADYRNPDYEAISRSLNFLFEGEQAADRQGLYSTLYKYEDGQLYIIMDDDDGVNMFKPFEMNEENEAALKGEVRTGEWEDASGKWMYAIGPVYDSSGKAVGIYETGRDLNVLFQANRKIYDSIVKNILIITSVLIVVILIATYLLLSTVRRLRRSVMEMADGNWDAEVRVRSRDEVGDLGEQFNRMARYIRRYISDITRISEASYRFVPQPFFRSLGKQGILDIQLGDQVQRSMPVMVANLREFYRLSQQLSPEENFNFMNSFLKRFGPLVRQEDGLISQYLGAGFMALYPGYPEQALRTAVAIRKTLVDYNEGRRRAGYALVDVGIAIHHGPLMMGIIGEEQRWEGRVISEDVHMASLLERLSEPLGASILVTKEYFNKLRAPERFRHRNLGRITPEGQDEAIELVDVYEGDPETMRLAKERTKALFERGLFLCQEGRFYDARETFVEVLKLNRLDKAAKLYFYLCDEYYQKGTSSGWNGTLAV
ncbi:HAMP domain-containing protein [Cohnella caldifontis]|uniref:HAMP domain-containing protein n=1 Tax=Cohnella caldifontis TaxID=3027471 RepID=UPI0023EAA776|nr:adenylate/guanylate cyclase domain-containing protein [Cohnella sp. YIM B05605]